jgi:nucleoside 2-deoxyribosyltransferase
LGNEVKIYFAHSTAFDYVGDLYMPIKNSKFASENELIFPHEDTTWNVSRETIRSSDMIVAEVSYASTGLGIELGWADAFGIPIICLFRQGTTPSGALMAICEKPIEYSPDTIVQVIERVVTK